MEEEKRTFSKRKKIIIFSLCVVLVIIFGIMLLNNNPRKLERYRTNFENNIKSYLENIEYVDNVVFEGDYSLNLTIYMNEKFKKLDFESQEPIIKGFSNDMEQIYCEYRDKVKEIDTNIIYDYGIIKTFIDEDKYYNNSFVSDTIYIKDSKVVTYTVEDDLRKKIINKVNDNSYDLYINYIKNIEEMKNIIAMETVEDCKREIIYLYSIYLYEKGDFKSASNYFKEIEEGYKERNQYLYNSEMLNKMQGTFRGINTNLIIINGWNIICGIDPNSTSTKYGKVESAFTLKNNEIILSKKLNSKEKNDLNISEKYKIDNDSRTISDDTITYKYESKRVTFPNKIKEPAIGMTKAEAEASTWGYPNKINKTTTAYGTHEQWVYGNRRYLYFDNGKLTSIQE